MNDELVSPKFRNVICPWQTKNEIRAQEKFLLGMLKKLKLDPLAEARLLKNWTWKGEGY